MSIGINNVTGMQYLIPTKRQNLFTITVLIGAGVNFVLNLVLIYFFQSIGAAIASVAAETVIALVQIYIVRKELKTKEIFLSGWHYLLAGGIMLFVLKVIGNNLMPSIMHTVILVVGGATIYGVLLFGMRDEFLLSNMNSVFGKIIKRKG